MRKGMSRAGFALLLSPALPLVALALAACGHAREAESGEGAAALPLGLALAMAGAGAAAADDSAKSGASEAAAPVLDVTPQQLAERMRAGNVRVIDVRTDAEVAEGMIPGAEHIPLDRFDPAALDLSDGRAVVLYCRSGRRSEIAARLLAEVTGGPVEHLAGGMIAWEAAGQPVEKR
jgi:rhodanese-related sulfurtransferase